MDRAVLALLGAAAGVAIITVAVAAGVFAGDIEEQTRCDDPAAMKVPTPPTVEDGRVEYTVESVEEGPYNLSDIYYKFREHDELENASDKPTGARIPFTEARNRSDSAWTYYRDRAGSADQLDSGDRIVLNESVRLNLSIYFDDGYRYRTGRSDSFGGWPCAGQFRVEVDYAEYNGDSNGTERITTA